jgi:hypothetical protein
VNAIKVRKPVIENIVILCLILLWGMLRSLMYGDMRLSIGNIETSSYIESSKAPLFSWGSFAGLRLFTTNIIYKIANNPSECKLTDISYPNVGGNSKPAIQSCFENIALLQNLLGIFAWCYLAWTTAHFLKRFPSKVGVVILILVFGFTPQIAEWDTVLSPESLSVSLFVVLMALSLEIVFRIVREEGISISIQSSWLGVLWLIIFFLWIFLRDVHLYSIPVTVAFVALLLISAKAGSRKVILAVMGFLAGLFILGYVSAQDSHRATRGSLSHSFQSFILPFPSRVAFFTQLGMPADSTTPAYNQWLADNATKTYTTFLLTHPGFVVTTLEENSFYFGFEFVQQYFTRRDLHYRSILLKLGEVVHPESTAVYLIDILCLAGLYVGVWKGASYTVRCWAWIGSWSFFCSVIVLMASFFGDTEGVRRHIFPAVETLRLLMWLLVFVYLDEILDTLSTLWKIRTMAKVSNTQAAAHNCPSAASGILEHRSLDFKGKCQPMTVHVLKPSVPSVTR